MTKKFYIGNDYLSENDGSLAQNEWMYITEGSGKSHWLFCGSDYKIKTGLQTINGKVYKDII